MPRPKPRYRVSLSNLETGKSLKIELVDLPFAGRRTFRLRVNGEWARKVPVGSKILCCGKCEAGGCRVERDRRVIGSWESKVRLSSRSQKVNVQNESLG